jgi:hypothetical protein
MPAGFLFDPNIHKFIHDRSVDTGLPSFASTIQSREYLQHGEQSPSAREKMSESALPAAQKKPIVKTLISETT